MAQRRAIILASTSNYRRQLLARLRLPFECVAPQVAEDAEPEETPAATALRLAILKAKSVAQHFPGAIIIGSDQVASCDGVRLGKPGNRANAIRQLEHLSGRTAAFDTALCVLDAASGVERSRVVSCRVAFRALTRNQIETYLDHEQPYDCAGSAKSEGLGIALLARIQSDDPTALIGLPLIALTELLADSGVAVLS